MSGIRVFKAHTSSDTFKQKLKSACLVALNLRRQRIIQDNRELYMDPSSEQLSELVSVEYKSVKKEAFLEIMDCAKDGDDDMTLDDLDDDNPDFHLSGDDYIDVMRFLEESLAREKMEERERAEEQELEEMEACEEEMCRVMAQLHTEDDYVPCPVCKRNKLGQLMGVIYCSCGLRINVQSDSIKLDYVRDQLGQSFQQHRESGCGVEPVCGVEDKFGTSMLMMTCPSCPFMRVIV